MPTWCDGLQIAALQALQGSSKSEAQAEIDRLKGQFAAEKEKLEATLKEQKSAAAQVLFPLHGC